MRSLLVTGAAGFIGSNFVDYWLREHSDDRILALDALSYAGNLASLDEASANPRFRFVQGNICDRGLVERLLRDALPDTIVHFAAESHVDRSIAAPEIFVQTNVLGTQCLLEGARKVWLDERAVAHHRFHHVSTDEVFGSLRATDPPSTESSPYAPNSPYAASKAAADHLVRAYHRTYGLSTTISNCSNNYGPRQFPEKLIPLMIVNILHAKKLPIYGDGRNVRDWLHVEDHCRGIEAILSRGVPGETYNIGGRCETENLALVQQLCVAVDELFAAQPHLRTRFPDCPAARGATAVSLMSFVADRPGHDRRYAIDCSKIESELSFALRSDLQTGLRDTLLWYLENEGWWRRVMDGSYRQWVEAQYGGS